MTEPVPTPPSDIEPVSTAPPRSAAAYIAWAVIWICVAFLMLASVIPSIRGRKAPRESAATNMQMELQAKYAIGVRQLLPTQVPVIPELEKIATAPKSQVDVAIAAGELISPEEALKRLSELDTPTLTDALKQEIADLRTLYTAGLTSLDEPARRRLIDQHGYFGKMALAFKQPDSDPNRREILDRGKHTAVVLFAALGIAGFLGIAGLALLVTGIVLLATGSTKPAYRPSPSGSVYLEMFAVYLASFILLSLLVTIVSGGNPSLAVSWLLSIVLPLAIGWGMFRGVPFSDMRQALGWHAGRGLHIEIPLGIAGYVGGLPIVVAGFVVTYLLLKLSGITPSHPIQNELVESRWQALQLYAIACIWAPVIEETMFRGVLFNHLRQRWSWIVSASVVAFIFAAIHPQGWTFIPVLGSIAIVLAGLREWRGSIIPSMVAHACNNFVMVSLLIALK